MLCRSLKRQFSTLSRSIRRKNLILRLVDGTWVCRHPIFNSETLTARRKDLWSLQGVNRTWFCGAWFGAGFHEDGAQAGLAVAEQLGGLSRPWVRA